MKRVEVASYPVSIFIAGSYGDALYVAQRYCDDVGLCVTVTKSRYVYKGGTEDGVVVGLINYPRFPLTPAEIWLHAEELAELLRADMGQDSYSIQAPDKTVWFSKRHD